MRPSASLSAFRQGFLPVYSGSILPQASYPAARVYGYRYQSSSASTSEAGPSRPRPPPPSSPTNPSNPTKPARSLPLAADTATTTSRPPKPVEEDLVEEEEEDEDDDPKGKRKPIPIPMLPRPLGVSYPPVASDKTYISSDKSLERKAEERSFLWKEATSGYFRDYNQARRRAGGKSWIAPKVLIREDRSLYLPNIGGTNLLGKKVNTTDLCTGKTTLLALTSTRLAEEHVQSFIEPVLSDQEGNPDFNYVEINHQQNHAKAFLLSMFQSSLKRTVPQERWGNYLLSRGEWSEIDVSYPLAYENKIIGYVFLVDPRCKVRWAGCGLASQEEVQSLRAATEILLTREKEARRRR